MNGPASTDSQPVAPVSDEIAVAAPPSLPHNESRSLIARLLPAVMMVGMLGLTVLIYRSGALPSRSPAFAVLPLLMVVSSGTAALMGRNRFHHNAVDGDREDYLAYLVGLGELVASRVAVQRAFLRWSHPHPESLWMLAGGPRMWERRPSSTGFGSARVGIGPAVPATRLTAPEDTPARAKDPVTEGAVRRFLDSRMTVPDVPVALRILGTEPLVLGGNSDRARGLLRAMICQLATSHGPDVLLIAILAGDTAREWDWLKWLPHHQHPAALGDVRTQLLVYPDLNCAEADLAGRRAVVIIDDAAGLRITELGARGPIRALQVSESALNDSDGYLARPDYLPVTDAVVCARRLAGHGRTNRAGADAGWAQLLGVDDIDEFDPVHGWTGESTQRLCVPIGTDDSGEPLLLDIKEAAERGSGPHGLCIGATGSGKSEFLRTLVLGLVARHSPEELNLVLVDFKGGATFLGFERVRHVAALITNLADEVPLVERMSDALSGEMHRRQELLRTAGAAGTNSYTQLRHAGQRHLPALPALLVIVDEFSELLHQHPDFLDTFVAIGRLGRSLGVHLLLASQRLEEGRLRGLDSHLSYRVCLKTMSAAESRIVLGTSDAHELPNLPGLGYLRTADGAVRRFHTAYVSGACPSRASTAGVVVRPFTAASSGRADQEAGVPGRTVAQAMLERLAGHGPTARRIWLPPLRDSPHLGALLDDCSHLRVPIAVVDRPFEQRRTTLAARLDGSAGHVAVVGAPRSGKSTALHTLIAALSATHDATRVAFYCLDFGGGALAGVAELPQVGTVAGRGQPDLARRMVAEVHGILARREAGQNTHGDPAPDVFLVIDGWAALCVELDRDFDVAATVAAIAARGLSYGVHVMLSASRWADVRPALRDLIGTRIELRLGDPAESEIDCRRARLVPSDQPGRGLTQDGMHMVMALPQGWTPLRCSDVVTAPIRMLPSLVDRSELLAADAGDDPILGIDERGLDVVTVDFERQPHLLVQGDNECGKSSVLRTICRELVRTRTAAQAQLLIIDYRRALLGVVPTAHMAGYAMNGAALSALLPRITELLADRMPGPDLSPQQLRARSWWSGPQLYLVVDDYDVVAGATANPLTTLLEYLPHASDLGVHLLVARRSGGVARSMYDPMVAALTDLGAARLEMSQDTVESPLRAARRAPLPPGRGTLITRADGERLIQVAWEP